MKKFFWLFVMALVVVLTSAIPAFAQFRSVSNEARVGFGGPAEAPPGSGQIPGTRPVDYRQALIDEFGIVMNGFSQDNMMWAWEFMHQTSNTRFPEYVVGSVVGVDNGGSHMTGCKTIFLRSTYGTRDLFTVVFAHELGHIVYHCSAGGSAAFRADHLGGLGAEGPLTPYSQNLCYYTSPGSYELETENFAELIAYYLNPNTSAMTGCGSGPNPFAGGANSQQYGVARSILER